AFSTENWARPKKEVDGLMELLVQTLRDEIGTLQKNDVRLLTIGDTASLPDECRENLAWAMEQTKDNSGLTLIMALSYSGRSEIINAAKKIAEEVTKGNFSSDAINEELFKNYL